MRKTRIRPGTEVEAAGLTATQAGIEDEAVTEVPAGELLGGLGAPEQVHHRIGLEEALAEAGQPGAGLLGDVELVALAEEQ